MCHGHAAMQENCYALQATGASRGRVHWSRDLSVSYASHAATSSTRCFSSVPPGSCGTVCAGQLSKSSDRSSLTSKRPSLDCEGPQRSGRSPSRRRDLSDEGCERRGCRPGASRFSRSGGGSRPPRVLPERHGRAFTQASMEVLRRPGACLGTVGNGGVASGSTTSVNEGSSTHRLERTRPLL